MSDERQTDTGTGIEIELQHRRGNFSLDVALHLPADGVSVVFGPSGCGKSTLLRAIAGLEPEARGIVRLRDEVWQDEHHRLPAHQRRGGVVFQHAALLPHLSVLDNLRYGWRRAGGTAALLEEWIDKLELAPLLARRAATLSGGEQQRVALARALVSRPQWLLLDEPLSALDGARRAEILPYLEAIKRDAGIPMLYVTHSVEEVARLADHLVLLDAGRVTASGAALDVLNRPDLPLALREDAGVVLEARACHQDEHGLIELDTPAGRLHAHAPAARVGHRPGTPLRVRIQARDVSLALQAHTDTSLLNLLPATITALSPLPGGQVQIRLDAGGQLLLARVSHRSVERLDLRPGLQLWAQIKAVALLV
ncbi:molybdenum ABC transporter ATPase [Lysobacter concretionis Ko07 = DSM 16239]|uniref:Molybdenum ABC transporter ATPase n=1 Tax=Lysobacter concretionis Ko07 = DSM 16239 TaxID=1122185 RepID=A0A0A0EMT6_9GAMM|nr:MULTISPECIES: molybdenum ABC transporter ATP-binding protein [Lysobacter]KGM52286.1 molybdenum ABC transporter ATPase [Lysobacter concretionis Ko07 = DSM 16239]QOD91980.1 molybdenum ABC transporter ATP-binding protein [Lysobacter sp. CW239]